MLAALGAVQLAVVSAGTDSHISHRFEPCRSHYAVLVPLTGELDFVWHLTTASHAAAGQHLFFWRHSASPASRVACEGPFSAVDDGPKQWECRIRLPASSVRQQPSRAGTVFLGMLAQNTCKCLECGGEMCSGSDGKACDVCGTWAHSGCSDTDFSSMFRGMCYTTAPGSCACQQFPDCWRAGGGNGAAAAAGGRSCLAAGERSVRAIGAIAKLQVALSRAGSGRHGGSSSYRYLPPMLRTGAITFATTTEELATRNCSALEYEFAVVRSALDHHTPVDDAGNLGDPAAFGRTAPAPDADADALALACYTRCTPRSPLAPAMDPVVLGVGTALGVILCAFLARCTWRKHRKRGRDSRQQVPREMPESDAVTATAVCADVNNTHSTALTPTPAPISAPPQAAKVIA